MSVCGLAECEIDIKIIITLPKGSSYLDSNGGNGSYMKSAMLSGISSMTVE